MTPNMAQSATKLANLRAQHDELAASVASGDLADVRSEGRTGYSGSFAEA